MVNISDHLRNKRIESDTGKAEEQKRKKIKDLWFKLNRLAKRGHAVNVGKNATLEELQKEFKEVCENRPWIMKT